VNWQTTAISAGVARCRSVRSVSDGNEWSSAAVMLASASDDSAVTFSATAELHFDERSEAAAYVSLI
jgi:hypothetical protein